jgi:hypothetical protein
MSTQNNKRHWKKKWYNKKGNWRAHIKLFESFKQWFDKKVDAHKDTCATKVVTETTLIDMHNNLQKVEESIV